MILDNKSMCPNAIASGRWYACSNWHNRKRKRVFLSFLALIRRSSIADFLLFFVSISDYSLAYGSMMECTSVMCISSRSRERTMKMKKWNFLLFYGNQCSTKREEIFNFKRDIAHENFINKDRIFVEWNT